MTSIANLFSNFDDLTKNKSVTDSATVYTKHKFNSRTPTPALTQGERFKNYQKKIKKNLAKNAQQLSGKEGFGGIDLSQLNLNPKGLTIQSERIINNNNYSSQQQNISNLKKQYQDTLTEYENLLAAISGNVSGYVDRVNPSNPYLGKNVYFTTGEYAYVTQQGVVKMYPKNSQGTGVDGNVLFSTAGKNGCPGIDKIAPINLPWLTSYNSQGATIPSDPPLVTGTPMVEGQSCGSEGKNVYVNSMINNPNALFDGCWADNTTSPLMTFIGGAPSSGGAGSYTYEMCQTAAVNEGYQYFALQNVNASTNKGFCAVGNNSSTIKSLGPGLIPNNLVPLWASNTGADETSTPGSTAMLSVTGALSVLNSSGQAIFNTPTSNANPSNYLGCYGDGPNRAMPLYNGGSQQYNNAQCQQIAQQNGATYYGLQNSTSGTTAQCAISSNWQQTSEYGVAGNCTQIGDGSYSGGGWSNAVYNTSLPQSNYFLALQDDGNMVIYRGTSPSDNQGVIWASGTNGKLQQANPNYAAAKGKYGQNYITQGSTLAAGDFIGSNSGSMALIMQNDGNLVLYTFSMASNCEVYNGKFGGGVGVNALYNLYKVGTKGDMGKVAYIDQNAELHAYPASNFQYTNSYTKLAQTDSVGNDIQGAAYGNASVEQCQTSCNDNPSCAGFAFENNVCFPKTNAMYPVGESESNISVDLYLRNATPGAPPIGVPSTTNNTDSISYQNYVNGGALSNKYGLANATSVQQQQLAELQNQMNYLSNSISGLTTRFGDGSQTAATQMNRNVQGVGEYLTDIRQTNRKIKNYNTGIDNILKDSDIVVLQKNYDYLFWSILAAGSVLVAMNIIKK